MGKRKKWLEQEYDEDERFYTGKEFFVKMFYKHRVIVEPVRQLFSKSFMRNDNLRFYEGIVHEDTLFSVISAMNAQKVYHINQKLYEYRRRDGSTTSMINEHRVKSYFIVFMELWTYWREHCFSDELNTAFGSFLTQLWNRTINGCSYFENIGNLNSGLPAYDMMFQIITKRYDICSYITNNQLKEIKASKRVIVYGAGKVGIEVVRFLHIKNIIVEAIAVSNKELNPDYILGVKIIQIEDVMDLKSAIVIVAVAKTYQNEVEQKLKEAGKNENVIFCNDPKFFAEA